MNRKRHATHSRDQTPEKTAAPEQHRGHHTPQAQHERQQRVLTQGKSAMVRGIADAVVMKNQQSFSSPTLMDASHDRETMALACIITTAVFSGAMRCSSPVSLPRH
jgi:hypothetical protein